MASVQIVTPGPFPGSVDTVATVALGTKAQDELGNEYIYLQGVAGTLVGDLVVYSDAYLTTRGVAASTGPAAFATAAVLALQFGWYQIGGDTTGTALAAVAINAGVARSATAGNVTGPVTAGNAVFGVYARAAVAGPGPILLRIVHPPHIIGVAP
jgi:hypothetical protein